MNGLPTKSEFDKGLKSVPLEKTEKFLEKWKGIAGELKAKTLAMKDSNYWYVDITSYSNHIEVDFRVDNLPLTGNRFWGKILMKFTNDNVQTEKRGVRMIKGIRLRQIANYSTNTVSNKSIALSKVPERLEPEFTAMWNDQLKRGFKFIQAEKTAELQSEMLHKEVTNCGGQESVTERLINDSTIVGGKVFFKDSLTVQYRHGTESNIGNTGRVLTISNMTTAQMQSILKNLTDTSGSAVLNNMYANYNDRPDKEKFGVRMAQKGASMWVMQADVVCPYSFDHPNHQGDPNFTVSFALDSEYDISADAQRRDGTEYWLDGKRIVGSNKDGGFLTPCCDRYREGHGILYTKCVVYDPVANSKLPNYYRKEVKQKITYDEAGTRHVWERDNSIAGALVQMNEDGTPKEGTGDQS